MIELADVTFTYNGKSYRAEVPTLTTSYDAYGLAKWHEWGKLFLYSPSDEPAVTLLVILNKDTYKVERVEAIDAAPYLEAQRWTATLC